MKEVISERAKIREMSKEELIEERFKYRYHQFVTIEDSEFDHYQSLIEYIDQQLRTL